MTLTTRAILLHRLRVGAPSWMRCLAMGLAVIFGVSGQSCDEKTGVAGVECLIAQYAKSIDGADTALAAKIWSQSPDVSFIHPRGHEHGFDQVVQNVYIHLMGEMFSERKLTIKEPSIRVYGDTAWAEFDWEFVAKLRSSGAPLTTKGRETQIYHQEQGRWRLVHVHYSGQPVTGEGRGF